MATMRLLLSEIDLISVGEVAYPPGGRLGPRWQHDVELVIVHDGSARIAIDDGEPVTHRPGSVVLLLPGLDWDCATRRNLAEALPASTALTDLVREAVAVARTPLPTRDALLAALVAAALWRYVGEAESHVHGPSGAVESARRFLHAYLADPHVDLERVARAAHVTPAHLVRRFRAELGTAPIAYLWRHRVDAGLDLLVNTGLPVGEIAARTGFKSVYHFSRRVKERTGVSPTEVRRERWAGEA